MARLVATFDVPASGIHRVGTPGDFASGAWFEGEAATSGIAVSRMPVPIQRTVVEDAYIECAGIASIARAVARRVILQTG